MPPGPASRPNGRAPVAPASRLFGRVRERVELRRWLDDGERVITLTGPGGVGKSRLAVELAVAELADVPAGERGPGAQPVVVADLGAARTRVDTLVALADALGWAPGGEREEGLADGIGGVLADRGARLVVLDDADAVVEPLRDLVGRWRAASPSTAFVVTSRDRLGVPEERVRVLGPLDPADGVALFRDRALRAGAELTDSAEERAALDTLVARLDGLPLALEICAGRADWLSPARLAESVGERFVLSSGGAGRHASMDHAIALSWDLLPDGARAALSAVCVLEGPFDVELAAVVIGGADALEQLALLQRRSLVTGRGDALRVYETVRGAVLRRGGAEAARARRDAYVLGRTESLGVAARGWEGAAALDALDRLVPQLAALVREARDGLIPVETGLRAALAIALHRRRRALPEYGEAELQALLARVPPDAPSRPATQAAIFLVRILGSSGRTAEAAPWVARAAAWTPPGAVPLEVERRVLTGWLAFEELRYADAEAAYTDAIALGRGVPGAEEPLAMALANRVLTRVGTREPLPLEVLEEARALFLVAGAVDRLPVHQGIVYLAASRAGQPARARAALEDGLDAARRVGSRRDLPTALGYLGADDLAHGRLGLARAHLLEGFEALRLTRSRWASSLATLLALVEVERGQLVESARWRREAISRGASGTRREHPWADAVEVVELVIGGDVRGAAALAAQLTFVDEDQRRLVEGVHALIAAADAEVLRRAGDPDAEARLAYARVRRAVLDDAPLDEVQWIVRHVDALLADLAGGDVLVVAPDGRAYRLGAPWEDLARRPLWRRLLLALVQARLDHPGAVLDVGQLGEAGWPGEKMLASARDNRLYVALTKLRQSGLGNAIESPPGGGWRLRPDLRLRWSVPR